MPQLSVKKVLVILLIPVLLYLVYFAGTWGLADMYARPAINTLEEWQKGKKELEEEDWQRLQANLEKAIELDPTNPDINLWLGKVIEGPYAKVGLRKSIAKDARLKAAGYYRESIRLRRTWPFAWIDLAMVKYRLFEIDDEFFHAVRRSMYYGPWEPDILRVVSDFGMVLWKILDENNRDFFLTTTRRAFQHISNPHVKALKAAIVKRNFVDRLCESTADNVPLTEFCKQELNSN